jgi:carbon storage regulator CsrA
MFILARGVGQVVKLFDGKVEVQVLSIQGSIVRLGFTAPKEVSITRGELDSKSPSKETKA